MTQEEKQLLLKDLSARLPYHVKVKVWLKDGTTEEGFLDLEHNYGDVLKDAFYSKDILDIKPYLRPMSSMTEEEKEEYRNIDNRAYSCPKDYAHIPAQDRIDWLNAHHFDYRGLIGRGLAIAVTEDNNPYEQNKS